MGLFKKRISAEEFGLTVLSVGQDVVTSHACRALASCFQGWRQHDFSGGPMPFFEKHGLTKAKLQIYFRFAFHSSLHAMALQYQSDTRRKILQGGMRGFAEPIGGYDFDRTYSFLESAYSGVKRFDEQIEHLKAPESPLHFLPVQFQSAGIVNARFLLAECIIPNFKIRENVVGAFENFSSGINATVGVVQRAANQVLRDVKLAPLTGATLQTFSNIGSYCQAMSETSTPTLLARLAGKSKQEVLDEMKGMTDPASIRMARELIEFAYSRPRSTTLEDMRAELQRLCAERKIFVQ